MCKGSLEAAVTEPAVDGIAYRLGRLGSHPAFYQLGSSPAECVVCVPDGARLEFVGIGSVNRWWNDIASNEVGTFIFMPNQLHDYVRLADGREIKLSAFIGKETRVTVRLTSAVVVPLVIPAAGDAVGEVRLLAA